jgi:MFS family permease
MMVVTSFFILVFGLFLEEVISIHSVGVMMTLFIGMALMGLTYGPLGTMLSNVFPTEVRYTGASLSFNLSGILGASFAPFIALWLANNFGFAYVGYYLSLMGFLSLIAAYYSKEKS